MAFQQGGLGSGRSAPEQPATEYTLQGVMRFLQIEWHSHERARNAWDIERAEMRAKIAKQAGELRQAKRINEQLERQVRMLENALRNERKKKGVNGAASAEKCTHTAADEVAPADSGSPRAYTSPRAPRADDGQPTAVSAATGPQDSFLHTDAPSETEREQYLDNTSKYLKNCIKEIQYLLTPPQHPPPAQVLPKGHITALPDPPLSRAEQPIYHEPDSRGNGRGQRSQVLPRQPPPLTHQPPPVPDSLPQAQAQPQYTQQVQQMGYAEYTPQGQHATDVMQPPPQQIAVPFEEQVEKVTHTYDNKGRPVLEGNQALHDSHARCVSENLHLLSKCMKEQAEADGWTFEEETPLLSEAQPADPPRRPDTDLFPSAAHPASIPAKSPPPSAQHGRRKSSGSLNMSRRRSSQGKHDTHEGAEAFSSQDSCQFKVRYALRGHLDVVRTVIFSGGGSPSEPEVCTAGDDGTIKRWIIPATYQSFNPSGPQPDLDIGARFTHRGHEGIITSLTAPPASTGFSTGGQAPGGGWIFSGGQDATIRCWERGRVDPKATLEGHTDAVWAVCVLPASVGVVFGLQSTNYGGPDRLLLVSGSADGTVKVWAVSAPPQSSPPSTGSRRGVGGTRRHSVTSGSNYPTSPQPSVASDTPFNYTLIHSIERPGDGKASPTSIYPLSPSGETFVVSYTDSCVLVFDTRTGEEIIGMASNETYDGTMNTSINSVVATSSGLEGASPGDAARGHDPDEVGGGATGGREGVEGVVITGHEDRFVRFFDANSGQCTYGMLAHPSAISALSLSKDGREAVSAGHDASIRFWSLEKRICTQDIVSHRAMRGEGVCDVCWSQDGRLVVSAGGDGVVKVFAR